MDIVSSVTVCLMVFVLFVCLVGVCGFVAWGALKWHAKRSQAGIDAEELTILRGLFLEEAKASKEADLKAKLSRLSTPPKPIVVRSVAAPAI